MSGVSKMNKELEYLEEIKSYFPFVDLGKGKEYVCEKEFNAIKQALQRLEAIENVKPSEALECLEYLYSNSDDYRSNDRAKDYETIKNYILKTQEQKKYLKWEDLEFSKELKVLNVRMNNNNYILQYTLDVFGVKCCFLCDSEITHHISLTRQFFNDLNLEVLE